MAVPLRCQPVAVTAGRVSAHVGGGMPPNVAVYVVAELGAVIWCACPPPSDQPENAYQPPFSDWGEGAEIEFVDPTMKVRVIGLAAGSVPPMVRPRPTGLLVKVRSTVLG